MLYAGAPGAKSRVPRLIELEVDTLVVFEVPKVAISLMELGTVVGVQLVAVFQSLVAGLEFQVALPASAMPRPSKRSGSRPRKPARRRKRRMRIPADATE